MRNGSSNLVLRRLLVVAALGASTLVGGVIYAGDAGAALTPEARENHGESRGGHVTLRDILPILESINLTQDQRATIGATVEAAAKQLREEAQDHTIAADARRKLVRSLMIETHQKIAAELDDRQREQFKVAVAEMRNRRASEKAPEKHEQRKLGRASGQQPSWPGAQGRAVFRALDAVLDDLGLTNDQRTQIRQVLTITGTELRELMQADSMKNADRAGFANELIASAKRDIDAVLTPQQQEQFDWKFRAIVKMARQQHRADKRGAAPSTQPSTQPLTPGEGERNQGEHRHNDRGVMMLNRLQKSLEKLNLDEGQQVQADKVMDGVRSSLRALRDNTAEADPQMLRRRAREIFEDGLVEIRGILTPDQATRLQEMMRPPGEQDRPHEGPPKDHGNTPPTDDQGNAGGLSGSMNGSITGSNEYSKANESNDLPISGQPENDGGVVVASDSRIFGGDPTDSTLRLVEVGHEVPAFLLNRLDGHPITLDSMKGKPVVLLFGSYTSPSFRQRAVQFQELAERYDNKVQFLVIYTAEAHPSGQWQVERNQQEGIEVESHADLDARFAAARMARDKLKLNQQFLPVAPDKMDDQLSKTLGGFPNGLAVIDQHGKLYARQRWADPFATQAHLESLLSGK